MPDLTQLENWADRLAMLAIPEPCSKDRDALIAAASILRKIVAGEYKQVMHAKWKLVSEGAQCNLVKCTNCGHSIAVARNVPLDEWRAAKPYCDQCGALMDGKDDSHAPWR